jgi:hypothetical protein
MYPDHRRSKKADFSAPTYRDNTLAALLLKDFELHGWAFQMAD